METVKQPHIFQIDSSVVKQVYEESDNYKITFDESVEKKNTCTIYFSSNDIYYPNTEPVFNKRIVEKNSFEWLSIGVANAYKHIYIRDVHKQWYLTGINKNINSPEAIFAFLQNETAGLEIITLGSSAGGYAAVLYGSLLNAKKVLTFNGQFEIKSLLKTSNPVTDPLIFRNANSALKEFYDLRSFINPNVNIYYFLSVKSAWDAREFKHIANLKNIKTIAFKTGHHGIPFLKVALETVINLEDSHLNKLAESKHFPVFFSIRMVGLLKTLNGLFHQIGIKWKKLKVHNFFEKQ
jgi:esterase/lipase superfamily enzyme